MKTTPLIAALTLVLTAPSGWSQTELEKLRALVAEQERQIRMLEDENMKLRSYREVPAKPEPPASALIANRPSEPVPAPAAATAAAASYTVVAGDNLMKISRKTGVSPDALARANGLKAGAIIHPGQKLKIPGTAAAPAVSRAAPAGTSASTGGATHTVQPGETFYSISRKHNIPTEALIAANPETKPSALRPGQKLRLDVATRPMLRQTADETAARSFTPVSQPAPAPTQAPTAAATSPEKPAATAAAPAKQPVIRSVMIDGEMTYGEFAAKHGTNPGRLNELNGLDLAAATVLAKGSELYVPAQP